MAGGSRRLTVSLTAVISAAALGIVAFALTRTYPVSALEPGRGEPLVLLDRHGETIRQVAARGRPGRERWVSLDQVSSHAILTLLASEDQGFFEHRGVDPIAVLRAMYLNLKGGKVRYGGSTITMQLMRMVHSRGEPRTLLSKLKESLLAIWLENSATKQQILEQYLNRVDFGHGAVGIEAAARRYFGKPAETLT